MNCFIEFDSELFLCVMTSAKYKLREMSLNIVDNKEEFDRIFSDKQGNRDNK